MRFGIEQGCDSLQLGVFIWRVYFQDSVAAVATRRSAKINPDTFPFPHCYPIAIPKVGLTKYCIISLMMVVGLIYVEACRYLGTHLGW